MYIFLIFIAVLGTVMSAFIWRRFGLRPALTIAMIFVVWGAVSDGIYTVVTWVGHDRMARREAADERRAANAERRGRRQSESYPPGSGPATPISPDSDQP